MSKALRPKSKACSPLLIADGFVHGWAFDPLRPILHIELRVDGVLQAKGLTGFSVNSAFYTASVPPGGQCGFSLPLPASALDGWQHHITIQIADWRALPTAPTSELTWHSGTCFGEANCQTPGEISARIGYRSARALIESAGIQVMLAGKLVFTRPLTIDTDTRLDGSTHVGRVAFETDDHVSPEQLEFWCEGIQLRSVLPHVQHKLVGAIEHIRPDGIRGWAINMNDPLQLQELSLLIDGEPHATLRPGLVRYDILQGLKLLPEEVAFSGFDLPLPPLLKDGREHTVNVYSRSTGTLLEKTALVYRHTKGALNLQQAKTLVSRLSQTQDTANRVLQLPNRQLPGAAKPQVSAVILNRNGGPCLEQLFSSFLLQNTVAIEFIVIDHASIDNSLAILRRWQEKLTIRVQALDHNASFSASCNRGARLATAPYVLFLNNDVVWLQDALPAMLESLRAPRVGLVGLRLLKSEFSMDGSKARNNLTPEVQHLGVRFTQIDDTWWPYEAEPETDPDVAPFAPTPMPAVTGAVMLCRKKQFLNAGGFDEQYFYGYEDVELCLRYTYAKKLVCMARNDLVALHHHGYTRLTGREPGLTPHHIRNQDLLAQQMGLWLKRQCWLSLVNGNKGLTDGVLTIGLAVTLSHATANTPQTRAILAFADALERAYPKARVLVLSADRHWEAVQDCHVLLAFSPTYDLRQLQYPRGDLRTACVFWAGATAEQWQDNPSFSGFDRCLVLPALPPGASKRAAKPATTALPEDLRLTHSSPRQLLGDLLNPHLRVTLFGTKQGCDTPFALELTRHLRSNGVLVYTRVISRQNSQYHYTQGKVSDVQITLLDTSLNALAPQYLLPPKPGTVNILLLQDMQALINPESLVNADQLWVTRKRLPAAFKKQQKKVWHLPSSLKTISSHLQQMVDQHIGRTFHTP